MAVTPSTMLELGTTLPTFELTDVVSGQRISSGSYAGKPLVVAVLCNHCPFVKHVQSGIVELGRHCAEHGVGMVAVSANDPATHPADAPEAMAELAERLGYAFPYLFDEEQSFVAALRAACTPEFYLFDADHRLAYRGQLDDARPGSDRPVTGADVKAAIDAVLAGARPPEQQTPSIGCNIKWKPGRQPDYAR